MKTFLLVLGCLFVLAVACSEAVSTESNLRVGSGSGIGQASLGSGGEEWWPQKIEPEVTKEVEKCPEDTLKFKFEWDTLIILKLCPPLLIKGGFLNMAAVAQAV